MILFLLMCNLFLVFLQVYGEYVSGSISDEQRQNVIRNSCPGAGACGGMYTANTMASAIEAMGMSLPYR
jgi:dihydroxy-acid dehydratase